MLSRKEREKCGTLVVATHRKVKSVGQECPTHTDYGTQRVEFCSRRAPCRVQPLRPHRVRNHQSQISDPKPSSKPKLSRPARINKLILILARNTALRARTYH